MRADLANDQRKLWDELESCHDAEYYEVVVEQTKLLILFYNSAHVRDLQRLLLLSQKVSKVGVQDFVKSEQLQHKLSKLASISLTALHK